MAYVLSVVIVYLVPLYLGYRIGTRKGYTTFRWLLPVVLFSWLGVLFVAFMPRTRMASVQPPSKYHVPGDEAQQSDVGEWLYGKQSGRNDASR